MCSAYVKKKFEEQHTDVLNANRLHLDESDLRRSWKQDLINLFVQGLFMYDVVEITEIFAILDSNPFFKRQLEDVLNLDLLCSQIYNNLFATHIIVPYILTFLPGYFLEACQKNQPFLHFDLLSYVFTTPVVKTRVTKLSNVLVSLMFLKNDEYTSFVNSCINQFSEIMSMSPILVMPYIKGLNDGADYYAIGGVDLYNYAHFSNPLIRAYGFYTQVFGTSEALETFYRWVSKLDNSALFDLINQNLDNPYVVESALRSHTLTLAKNKPIMLQNYKFDSGHAILRADDYYINMKNSSGKYYLSELLKVAYPYADSRAISNETIFLRHIQYKRNKLNAVAPSRENITIYNGNKELFRTSVAITPGGTPFEVPIYDFLGKIVIRELVFINPPGTRLEEFLITNSRVNKNSVIWVFTAVPKRSFFTQFVDVETENLRLKGITCQK
jgi:hypothetical protein